MCASERESVCERDRERERERGRWSMWNDVRSKPHPRRDNISAGGIMVAPPPRRGAESGGECELAHRQRGEEEGIGQANGVCARCRKRKHAILVPRIEASSGVPGGAGARARSRRRCILLFLTKHARRPGTRCRTVAWARKPDSGYRGFSLRGRTYLC